MMLSFREFVRQFGLLYFVVTVSYVSLVLSYSFYYGRLAALPQYDDVAYFINAIQRYHILVRLGIQDFLMNFCCDKPTLSPVITGMAVLSYVLFGIQDWAPYIMNGIFVFFLLLLVAWYFQKDNTIKNLMILFILTSPLLAWGVHDFRPDIWNGLFTSLACFMIIKAILDDDLDRTKYMFAGLLLGSSLLIKPSASLFTVAIYASGIMVSIFLHGLLKRSWHFVCINKVLYSVLIAIIIWLPYGVFAWRYIFNYVYDALVTNKAIWALEGDALFHMTFYLTGPGGKAMLGGHFWVALAFIAFLTWSIRKDKKALAQVVALIILTILSWFVVSINVVKTHFLGASFDWFILLSFAVVLQHALRLYQGQFLKRHLLVGVLFFAVVAGVIGYKHPQNWWMDSPVKVEQRNKIIFEIVGDLQKIYLAKKDRLKVFMPYTGYLAVDNLLYLLVQKGLENVYVTSYWLNYDESIPKIYNEKFSDADVVITASDNKNSLMTASQGVAGKNKDEINNLLFSRDDFSFYKSYIEPSGQKIFVYVKVNINQK